MKKLTLKLEDLSVESYAIQERPPERGTVFGAETAYPDDSCGPSCLSYCMCTHASECVCDPETGGEPRPTWWYSCNWTIYTCGGPPYCV
ncbi:MAG TPA: hypothetical protein VFY65_14690 [Longimicrobium sp.]|nr:hypothetical protein [Longimicrobium sp.]